MALDALCLAAAAHELRAALLEARVDKVYQPGRNEVVLAMHTYGGNEKLLLCAEPGLARAQLTGLGRENPATPPVFCSQASHRRAADGHRPASGGAYFALLL